MEEAALQPPLSLWTSLACLLSLSLVVLVLYKNPWPRHSKIYRILKSQGIDGPTPSFFNGNLEEMRSLTLRAKKCATTQARSDDQSMTQDYAKSLFPYLHEWRKNYGPTFAFWIGRRPIVCVNHPDLVREISRRVSLDLGKATHFKRITEPLFGRGIIKSNGPEWAYQRKTIAPEFFLDKVKGMVELMVESTVPLVDSWDAMVKHEGGAAEIVIDEYFRNFSADVISRACFGGSYSKGKEIFAKLRALSRVISEKRMHFDFPSWIKFFSTESERDIERLEQEIRTLILSVVGERMKKSTTSEEDLLRSILANAHIGQVGSDSADDFIVDNCKNIYFAGHETTAVAATWCLMLLASHPQWQDRARAEVMEVCGGQLPNSDMIMKMKILTWVIQETLRLYPPSPLVVRETFQDMNFGKLYFPKGVELWVPTSTMHHDPALWGADADEFNPARFARGVSGACKHPSAYIPFGLGARSCLGQNFALVELKVVLSLLLSMFTFSPSPRYRHSPAFRLIIEPEFGLPLIVKKVGHDGFTCKEKI